MAELRPHQRHKVSASCNIDVIQGSPLSAITPWTTPANRGAVGEPLVTPSGGGLVQTLGQTESLMKRQRPPTSNGSSDWTLHRSSQFLVIFLSWETWPLSLKAVLGVCGIERAAKEEIQLS